MAQAQLLIKVFLLTIILKHHFEFVRCEDGTKRTWLSSKGHECVSSCATKGEKYFWCKLAHSGWDYCSKSPLLDSYGNKCVNKCGRYGEKYDWCWTENGKWGYCSSIKHYKVYYKYFGSKTGKKCSSTCSKHKGSSYYWCHIDNYGYDYCSPKEGTNYYGTKCKTSCSKLQETSYYWCYDENDKWQYCSPASRNSGAKCSATSFTNSLTMPEHYATNNHFKKATAATFDNAILKAGSKLSKNKPRVSNPKNMNLCQDYADSVLEGNPKLVSTTVGGGTQNPILEVWYSSKDNQKIPYVIHAIIKQHHRKCSKSTFGPKFNRQMDFMNKQEEDEMGHIVSPKFCGPAAWYNLAPQKNDMKKSRDEGSWLQQEEWLSDMLDANPCVYLDQWIVLNYDEGNRRPGHFQLCYAFKDVVTNRVMQGPDAKLFPNE